MAIITDLDMRAIASGANHMLTESFGKGYGALVGRITANGERRFYFRYSGSTGQVRLPVGPFNPRGDGKTGFTVAQARDKARELSALYRSGVTDLREHFAQIEADRQQAEELSRQRVAQQQRDLMEAEAAAEREREQRLTVLQLFARWRETVLQPRIRADGKRIGRKDGGQYIADQFGRHVFPRIGGTPLDELRKADLLALLDAQTAVGKLRTANVLLTDLKQMLDFATERELIVSNPLATLKKSKVGGASVERDRVLTENELRQLSDLLPAARLSDRSQAAIWLTLATGVRVGELMGAAWADALPSASRPRHACIDALRTQADADGVKFGIVDIANRTWYLPDTKNQRDHTIHLSDFALSQLAILGGLREALIDSKDGALSPWVFPATENRRPVCVKSFGKQLADRQRQPGTRMKHRSKATEALSLPGGKWTAHDLRRTAATIMARLGFGSDTINECLNHVQADRMAKVYIRDRREADQKRAFDALGNRLDELMTPR